MDAGLTFLEVRYRYFKHPNPCPKTGDLIAKLIAKLGAELGTEQREITLRDQVG